MLTCYIVNLSKENHPDTVKVTGTCHPILSVVYVLSSFHHIKVLDIRAFKRPYRRSVLKPERLVRRATKHQRGLDTTVSFTLTVVLTAV